MAEKQLKFMPFFTFIKMQSFDIFLFEGERSGVASFSFRLIRDVNKRETN